MTRYIVGPPPMASSVASARHRDERAAAEVEQQRAAHASAVVAQEIEGPVLLEDADGRPVAEHLLA